MIMDSPPDSDSTTVLNSSSSNPGTLSRRQRLLGLAKATRDIYIPKLTGSVSSLASGVSNKAFGNGNDMYDEQGRFKYPKDTTITLFPSYTRKENGTYHIDVKGWLSCPGLMTRKNRLILSLAKQITRYGTNSATTTQAISRLESDRLNQDMFYSNEIVSSDLESLSSDTSSLNTISRNDVQQTGSARPVTNSSVSTNISNSDELIKERLSCFIARSIPNAELTITIGSPDRLKPDEIIVEKVITDVNGHFETCINSDYKPSVVQVKTSHDDTIFAFQDIMIIPSDGIGLISDIDDTIKITGIIGDKRDLMTNLLLNDVSLWNIPSMTKWYSDLYSSNNFSFHYVSNSPWQLYSTINEYFKNAKFPLGSVHLKQYTGNIISSLMEPSSSRKKGALHKILEDFPNKKFICVGDSGEHDLEAYVDLAKSYPTRVLAIYIRYVTDSLSDMDDKQILKEIRRILANKKKNKLIAPSPSRTVNAESSENLIDLSDSPSPLAAQRSAKLPPMVPKKPSNLRGNQLVRKPPLPSRDKIIKSHTDTEFSTSVSYEESSSSSESSLSKDVTDIQSQSATSRPPPPPRRSTQSSISASKIHNTEPHFSTNYDNNLLDNLQHLYNSHNYYQLEDMDKKGAQWIRRVFTALDELEGTNTEIKIFTDDESEFFKNTLGIINEYSKSNIS